MTRTEAARWAGAEPRVLVFDVNETLIDIESMSPVFEKIFGDRRVLREWFGQLVLYSMTLTLSGLYEDFLTLGQGVLKMVGDVHGVEVTSEDIERLRQAMLTMPAHPDVEEGLTALRAAGFRMVTLTNSPPASDGRTPLENAGLAGFFERRFSVQAARAYKPAPHVYHMVAQELGVPAVNCMMIACHVWDTIGAQSAGYTSGLLTRPGNARLPVGSLPSPTLTAPDLPALAEQLTRTWRR
ncbi:haloacid dehalogenase type II [Sphaerisporangium rubeum]|uniref:2-haloacid dehalogenase n=1 Tax=Sphaerisporangium rubeum TaxID=321317 RepID=A0A7X0IJV3_9ACTN|nr:haloacid dehalogenase type II [Sphaerisporangium rubeum]MBB6476531.1 2-haloacid dehalogenase [Sphaerisporangium rubeum]